MRRSKAPSEIAKFKAPFKSKNNDTKENLNIGGIIEQRSPFIVNCQDNVDSSATNSNDLEKSVTNSFESNLRYNVVFGKISKKKHKIWEGDGILEVSPNSIILKDESEKFLGQVKNSKSLKIEEGARLFVGNKEVEIIDSIEVTTHLKRPSENSDVNIETNHSKKQKKSYELLPIKSNFAVSRSKQSILHSSYEPLVMPTPNDEHQWECNTNFLPLTEVSIDAKLCRILRPHQREGIIFLYRCISGIRHLKDTGAILADEMGLGKTLQCISLIWTLMNQGPYGGKPLLKRILVMVPCSLVQNWNNEFIRWIGSHQIKIFSVNQKNRPEDYAQHLDIPVLIISYEMFVRGHHAIKDISFDMIVCDEGHRLKNSNIKAALLLSAMPCRKRILLTGTPVQNDLQEFFSLVDLVNPGVLGTLKDFQKKYAAPIISSKEPGASKDIVQKGKEKSEELNRLTSSFILRRTQSIIEKFLPVKNEYVIFCNAAPTQKEVYNTLTEYWSEQYLNHCDATERYMSKHLQVMHALKKICNHPVLLNESSQATNEDFMNIVTDIISQKTLSVDLVKDSGKLILIDCLLKFLSKTTERIVLVSCFTQTLDLLEDLCKQSKYKYERFDGSTSLSNRNSIVNKFNDKNSDVFVLLLSSKAGGVGLNLIGASRLVLYDSDWNPATDLQAMARIWREGQKKKVFIYRLLTSGSIEEKIFQRQLTKAGLSESIVDTTSESNVKLSMEEIKNLFNPIGNDGCITHTSLNCSCDGDGNIPMSQDDEVLTRESELLCENSSIKSSLRMNQLFQWEHHKKPISEELLKEMGFQNANDCINFIFKNKSM